MLNDIFTRGIAIVLIKLIIYQIIGAREMKKWTLIKSVSATLIITC